MHNLGHLVAEDHDLLLEAKGDLVELLNITDGHHSNHLLPLHHQVQPTLLGAHALADDLRPSFAEPHLQKTTNLHDSALQRGRSEPRVVFGRILLTVRHRFTPHVFEFPHGLVSQLLHDVHHFLHGCDDKILGVPRDQHGPRPQHEHNQCCGQHGHHGLHFGLLSYQKPGRHSQVVAGSLVGADRGCHRDIQELRLAPGAIRIVPGRGPRAHRVRLPAAVVLRAVQGGDPVLRHVKRPGRLVRQGPAPLNPASLGHDLLDFSDPSRRASQHIRDGQIQQRLYGPRHGGIHPA
mmetsp:Transcript_78402/g.209491  ORF Transcript_78402/g.209491 Transcript_78402/m.209491 type:complete len:292 (+) Transcript_78402:969-1844(+)